MDNRLEELAKRNPLFSSIKDSGYYTVGVSVDIMVSIQYCIEEKIKSNGKAENEKYPFTPLCKNILYRLILKFSIINFGTEEPFKAASSKSYNELAEINHTTKKCMLKTLGTLEYWHLITIKKGSSHKKTEIYINVNIINEMQKKYHSLGVHRKPKK
jgi:predicted transcriptional regulator